MKTAKTFRLSEKAIQILKQQGNETQYIEQLILNGQPDQPATVEAFHMVNQKLDMLIGEFNKIVGLSSNGRTEAFEASNTGSSPVEPSRTKRDILEEITDLESQRDEELASSQDREYSKEIADTYNKQIAGLWAEYHEREA